MVDVVTINRPEVVTLIEEAAKRLTHGNKTEAVARAVRRLLEQNAREGSLFGAHRGSVRIHEGADRMRRRSMFSPTPRPAERSNGDGSPTSRHPRRPSSRQNLHRRG